jgi:predicted  nucleic acid-binding Zn-ribbon protein
MNKLTVILSVIIAGLLIYIFAFTGHAGEDKYATQEHQIDSLSGRIAMLEKQQHANDSLIKLHKNNIIALDNEIALKEQKIRDIRKYYGDKIKNINNLTSAELNSFFADRYK